jgi:endo-1,4-beta-xylanase
MTVGAPRSSALKVAATAISLLLLGCGRSKPAATADAGMVIGSGGTIVGTGGASDASAAGGATGTGGQLGFGGKTGTGGGPGTGGATSAGGALVDGGGTSDGGGVTGAGGSMVGSGGSTGTGGTTGLGGSPATGGGTGLGGATGTGGLTGTGGSAATGGGPGSGGAAGGPSFPPKFLGNIDTRGAIRSDFTTYWNQFTPENAGKWPSVQGSSSSSFNWTTLDRMYKHCDDNGILFKEHCFIWGAGQPAWLSSLDTTSGPQAVKAWMQAFCDRYPKTRMIDVVNEPPPHTTPTYVNAIGGGNNTTWEWIANSFKWAREACPNAILILNDYQNIEYPTYVQHTIDIVNAIKKLGAPIDAIGCQTHNAEELPASTLKANIDNLVSATGLPVYITEYDINLGDDEAQKLQYQDHFPMFWEHADVKGVTIWGYIVGATWRANTGLVTDEGVMRPAMSWLLGYLGR